MTTAEIIRTAGRPSAEMAQQIHNDILDAAYRLFLDQGFVETTVEEIAALAKTTRRSIVHRFPTKDELLLAVAERKLAETLHATIVRDDEMSGDLAETFRATLYRLLTVLLEPDMIKYSRVAMKEAGRLASLGQMTLTFNETLVASYVRLILSAQKAGHFWRFSARTIADMAIGVMLSNPVNRALLGDPDFSDQHKIDIYFSEMWAIFAAML